MVGSLLFPLPFSPSLFKTFYRFLYFTSCTPLPLISLSLYICSPSLQSAHKKETNKKQANKKNPPYTGSCSVPQCFAQTPLLANVHCNESWSGSGPMASATLSILNPYPDSSWMYVVALFYGDPAAALTGDLRDWPFTHSSSS